MDLVTLDKPSLGGVRTDNEARNVRLAELEKKRAEEQARRRQRKARNKTNRLNEAMVRLNEAIHLINQLIRLFQKPLTTPDARPTTPDALDSKLLQPMAAICFQMVQTLPDLAAYWTAPARPIVPRDPEADTDPYV